MLSKFMFITLVHAGHTGSVERRGGERGGGAIVPPCQSKVCKLFDRLVNLLSRITQRSINLVRGGEGLDMRSANLNVCKYSTNFVDRFQ